MSTEIERIDDQLQRIMHGEAWHGPAVLELLEGVDARMAAAHPIVDAHSIWELVLHLATTYRVVLRRMRGERPHLTPDEDWPRVPTPTGAHWQASVTALREVNEELRGAIAAFRVERLDDPIVASPPWSAWVQFVGLTQHDAYHAGQIALLRRAASGG